MADRKIYDYAGAAMAIRHILETDKGLSETHKEHLNTAACLLKERQCNIDDMQQEAVEYVMENMEYDLPENAKLIYSTENGIFSDAYDEALEKFPEINPDELDTDLFEYNRRWREDEMENLNEPAAIFAHGKIHRWNGVTDSYGILAKESISAILDPDCNYDDMRVYALNGEIYGKFLHHDGTNTYHFRKLKVPKSEIADLQTLMQIHGIKDITESLYPDIAKIYGWPLSDNDNADDSAERGDDGE